MTDEEKKARRDLMRPVPVPEFEANVTDLAEKRAKKAGDSWMDQLIHGKNGPSKNVANVQRVLQLTPEFRGALALDELRQNFVLTRKTPVGGPGPGTDQTIRKIAVWMQERGFNVAIQTVRDGIYTEAGDNAFHPVQQYLNSLRWDGVRRIDKWLCRYANAAANDYTHAVGPKWLISAVARAFKPGCKADAMLVLEGPQGTGKSTAFSILGGEFFSDQVSAFDSKDSSMEVTRWWIIEHAELNSLSKAEASQIKAFVSRQSERFRMPYERVVSDVPRCCVFGGTVNPDGNGYLKDATGARRFWPVETHGKINTEALRQDKDQLWAEAVVRYRNGDVWWLSPEEEKLAGEEQEDRFEHDSWEQPIATFVETKERLREPITMASILTDALLIDVGKQTEGLQRKAGKVMAKLGYERKRIGPRDARKYIYERRHQRQ